MTPVALICAGQIGPLLLYRFGDSPRLAAAGAVLVNAAGGLLWLIFGMSLTDIAGSSAVTALWAVAWYRSGGGRGLRRALKAAVAKARALAVAVIVGGGR